MPAPELYRVLGNLAPMAHRLPQALQQLAHSLEWSLEVYEDDPERTPARQVTHAVEALTIAGRHASELGRLLDQAQLAINGQGHRGRLDDPHPLHRVDQVDRVEVAEQ